MKRKTTFIPVLVMVIFLLGTFVLFAMGGWSGSAKTGNAFIAEGEDAGTPLSLPSCVTKTPQNQFDIVQVSGVHEVSSQNPDFRTLDLPLPPPPVSASTATGENELQTLTSEPYVSEPMLENSATVQKQLVSPKFSSHDSPAPLVIQSAQELGTIKDDSNDQIAFGSVPLASQQNPSPSAQGNRITISSQPETGNTLQNRLPVSSLDKSDKAALANGMNFYQDGASVKTNGAALNPPPQDKIATSPTFTSPGTTKPVAVETSQLGTALPGPRQIEGAQTPQLMIEKVMPPEIPMNEIVTIKLKIRNSGVVRAKNVILIDRIPKGTRLEETSPKAQFSQDGELLWDIGDLDASAEKTVEIKVMPLEEGEFGSTASATFTVETTARTLVTRPTLEMEVLTSDSTYLAGSDVVFEIVLSNAGTGTAYNIVLEEYVPEGLYHPRGAELRSPIGNLRPGESKHLKLTMKGVAPGEVINHLIARGDGELFVESKIPVTILAPRLEIAVDGPKMRYLERKATYRLNISNSGSAVATGLKFTAQLPKGVDFVSTDSSGVYDPSKHSVHWALDELPAGQSGDIELVLLPKQAGNYQLAFSGNDSGELTTNAVHEMSVQGIAALFFEVTDMSDPVEVGRDATYEIKIGNQGTSASHNVSVAVQLSKGMEFVETKAPVQHQVRDGNIIFSNIIEIAPKEEKIIKITTRCFEIGDQRISVQVQSDDLQYPVTKEESTQVYGDE